MYVIVFVGIFREVVLQPFITRGKSRKLHATCLLNKIRQSFKTLCICSQVRLSRGHNKNTLKLLLKLFLFEMKTKPDIRKAQDIFFFFLKNVWGFCKAWIRAKAQKISFRISIFFSRAPSFEGFVKGFKFWKDVFLQFTYACQILLVYSHFVMTSRMIFLPFLTQEMALSH